MAKPILAAQLYTLREQMKTPEEIRAGLKKVRAMGYTSVQVSGIGAIDAGELNEICEGLGLSICVTHTPFESILNDTEKVAKDHLLWHCPEVGIGSGPGVFNAPGIELYRSLVPRLNEAGRKLARYGLKFAYHNHNAEFRRLPDGRTGMDYLIEETDPSLVNFILDTYWVQAGGASPADYIRKLKGRIQVIHFKDMAVGDDNKAQMAEIGGGNLNWAEIVTACEETGVACAAIEQDVCPRDPFDCLASSYAYLSRTFSMK